jgi:protoheme IX farnesyltransferase
MPSRVSGLLRASHPEPTAAVTAVAALLAWGIGHPPGSVATVAGAVLASQLAVGWSNDWLDARRDQLAGRRDKPIPRGAVDRRLVGVAAVLATLATPLLALRANPVAAACLTVALLSGLLYNWPLKNTPASVVPYLVAFGALPAFVVVALPDRPAPPAWLVVAGALLGGGAHFVNVLPDLTDDVRTGVRGLPHRCGPRIARGAAAGLLLAATLVLVFGPPGAPSWLGLAALAATAVTLGAGWYAARAAERRGARSTAAFRAVMLVAVIDVALLVTHGRIV